MIFPAYENKLLNRVMQVETKAMGYYVVIRERDSAGSIVGFSKPKTTMKAADRFAAGIAANNAGWSKSPSPF